MPDEEFLLVGPVGPSTVRTRIKQLSNVTHWEWCDDMRQAYSVGKMVIVPSRIEETFGRVPAEAMVSGIPCVVSDRGGLPEVVGDTGEVVTDIESAAAWIDAIYHGFESHQPTRQQQRVEKFLADCQIPKLLEIIESVRRD
jgi:glycosyltransferase involved in cell wall biosynthesis